MKLYYSPASTTSLPVVLFCAESQIPFEPAVVNLMTGEQRQEPFLRVNPRGLVPVLDDDGFVLTESSAILKYLATKTGSPTYPTELQARARVDERMDWINTEIYRELGYHLTYPQLLPHHVRTPETAQSATIAWGKEKAERSLAILDAHGLGDRPYIAGETLTIADYFAAGVLHVGHLVRADYSAYPSLSRWLDAMRALPSWKEVYAVFDGFAASVAEKPFVTIGA